MTQLARLTLFALLVVMPASVAYADEDVSQAPYEAMRGLHRLQEQMAHGSLAAQAAQAKTLAAIGTRFVEADPMVWRDPRNARAAILYLLSGGKPGVVRAVLSRSTMPVDTDRMLKGALAYAEGQDQIARDLLDPIDPRSVPAVIGGQLALVEATLFAGTDRKKSAHLLDLARLLVPGSLVEEAALRRQITLESDPSSLPRFVALSRQYLHRFQTSIYAQNLKQHFATMVVSIGGAGDVAQIGRLDPAIGDLPVAEQRALYLAIAKSAIVQGHTLAARYAAEHAATIAKDATRDRVRAQLYIDAAAIVTDDVVKGVAALEAADGAVLSPDDAALRDAALAVAHSVQAPVPEVAEGAAADATPETDAALLEQAQKSISSGDALLETAR